MKKIPSYYIRSKLLRTRMSYIYKKNEYLDTGSKSLLIDLLFLKRKIDYLERSLIRGTTKPTNKMKNGGDISY